MFSLAGFDCSSVCLSITMSQQTDGTFSDNGFDHSEYSTTQLQTTLCF